MQGQIREMAALLQGMGRGGDTILAHINPQEAMLLDAVTDGGSINPVTGMPEFWDAPDGWDDTVDMGWGFDEPSLDPGSFSDYGVGNEQDAPQAVEEPSLLGAILTAPLEVVGNIFGADWEATGRDVFGPDISRAMAGIDTPQPAGTVEVNPAGAVSGWFGGPVASMVGSFVTPTYTIDSSGNVVGQHGWNAMDSVAGLMNNVPSISRGTIHNLSADGTMGWGTYYDPIPKEPVPINTIQNPLDPPVETASRGFPPPNIHGVDGEMEYFPVGQPVARPEEIADAIIQQQEMARALTMPQPGYTRAGEGLIYL